MCKKAGQTGYVSALKPWAHWLTGVSVAFLGNKDARYLASKVFYNLSLGTLFRECSLCIHTGWPPVPKCFPTFCLCSCDSLLLYCLVNTSLEPFKTPPWGHVPSPPDAIWSSMGHPEDSACFLSSSIYFKQYFQYLSYSKTNLWTFFTLKLCFIYDIVFLRVPHTVSFITVPYKLVHEWHWIPTLNIPSDGSPFNAFRCLLLCTCGLSLSFT